MRPRTANQRLQDETLRHMHALAYAENAIAAAMLASMKPGLQAAADLLRDRPADADALSQWLARRATALQTEMDRAAAAGMAELDDLLVRVAHAEYVHALWALVKAMPRAARHRLARRSKRVRTHEAADPDRSAAAMRRVARLAGFVDIDDELIGALQAMYHPPDLLTVRQIIFAADPHAATWRERFANQGYAATERIRRKIILGMRRGWDSRRIGREIHKALDMPRFAAERIARTETQRVANAIQDRVYRDNADILKGVRYMATLDLRTCPVCGPDDGRLFAVNGPRPRLPRHPNCRCAYAPVTKSWRELGIDVDELPPATRASMDGQVPARRTYRQWAAAQTHEVVAVVGKGDRFVNRGQRLPVAALASDGWLAEVRGGGIVLGVGPSLPIGRGTEHRSRTCRSRGRARARSRRTSSSAAWATR